MDKELRREIPFNFRFLPTQHNAQTFINQSAHNK